MSSRNIVKVRDWIDLVFVKKRFYSSEAVFAAALPPVSRTQVPLSAPNITTLMFWGRRCAPVEHVSLSPRMSRNLL